MVADKLIHSDQTGFIKGRHIQDNLRIIQDVINYSHADDIGEILVALDLTSTFLKAYSTTLSGMPCGASVSVIGQSCCIMGAS